MRQKLFNKYFLCCIILEIIYHQDKKKDTLVADLRILFIDLFFIFEHFQAQLQHTARPECC